MSARGKYFLPCQVAWDNDPAPLSICEKGRQIGMSYVDDHKRVCQAAPKDGHDVYIVSRDEFSAKLRIRGAGRWAKILGHAAQDIGVIVFTAANGAAVQVQAIEFASGNRIYSLSSNPDAIAGKSGHVVLDEFALHKDQRTLYCVAKPVTQWGGTLSIISTHRGVGSVFNGLIRDIKERGNPMGWSLHTVPIQRAVEEGIVEKINAASGRTETREQFLARLRRECIDEEQWLQEYCCQPVDDAASFLSFELITACEQSGTLRDLAYLRACTNPLFLGMDIARTTDLTVIDVGELMGDVMHDRLRLELRNKSFAEQEIELNQLLALPALRRSCLDASGLGRQLAERARERWGWKVEPVNFTAQVKSDLAYPLRADFEDRKLRIDPNHNLRADLRGIKKEITAAGNERFVGDSDDSHCDRFWAVALRQHARGGSKQPRITVVSE